MARGPQDSQKDSSRQETQFQKRVRADRILQEFYKKSTLYNDFSKVLVEIINGYIVQKTRSTWPIDLNRPEIFQVETRTKDHTSLYAKLLDRGSKYDRLSDITDIVGARIITYFSEDVQRVSDIVKEYFLIDTKNSIDKASELSIDRFGYLSQQYIVSLSEQMLKTDVRISQLRKLPPYEQFRGLKAEIQIRSLLQHAWAAINHKYGYKKENDVPQQIKRRYARLAALLEVADEQFGQIRRELGPSLQKRNVPLIRSQGITELLPDLETTIDVESLVGRKQLVNLVLACNTTISNMLNADGTTDIRLDVATINGSFSSYRGRRQESGSGVVFEDVTLVEGLCPYNLTIRNVRVRACQISVAYGQIGVALSLSTQPEHNDLLLRQWEDVARLRPSLVAQFKTAIGKETQTSTDLDEVEAAPYQENDVSGKPHLIVILQEGFPGAFKSLVEEGGSLSSTDHGTRFMVEFTDVPEGVAIYGTEFEYRQPQTEGSRLTMVSSHDDSPSSTIGASKTVRLGKDDNVVSACWEWTANPNASGDSAVALLGFRFVIERVPTVRTQVKCLVSLAPTIGRLKQMGLETIDQGSVPRFITGQPPLTVMMIGSQEEI